ncbi:MAG: zinc ribbon domain-containing protein [Chloroflexi bacterium]|nr:zinc ribbon domain-containing protein [Chloroflexota bacterium]
MTMPISLTQINCPNCGAPLAWDGTYGKPITCPYCGSQVMPGSTEVDDVWLFTDPVARARFEFNGTLDELEHDIRYEVLRGRTWSDLDRECKRELDRLEREGLIRKLASFWALSPFPTVYRARQDGELTLGGRRFSFRKGQELVWACPMTRDRFELDDPILIGDFASERVQHLCGAMADAMMGRMSRMEA